MFSVEEREARPLKVKIGMVSFQLDTLFPSPAGRPYNHDFSSASCYSLP